MYTLLYMCFTIYTIHTICMSAMLCLHVCTYIIFTVPYSLLYCDVI